MQTETLTRHTSFGWIIWFILFAVLFFVILELGKHTLTGWLLGILALVTYFVMRLRFINQLPGGLKFLSWICLFLLFGIILWLSWPPVKNVPAVNSRNPKRTDIITVGQGQLDGVLTDDGQVEVYAGIPYAAPPVGELRWKEPQPAENWEGVLHADHFAPMSMQKVNLPIYDSLYRMIGYHDYKISLYDNYRPAVSEDSLYLNIWKPAGDVSNLPVVVYVHGGSLQTGQPWYRDYSGEGLAREGVIVVNMGYRLGIFGFMGDETLAAESENHTTGNYGLLDQIAALRWVQENIEYFGGDPGNVTLAGESAGSACVSALCTSPLARGLFRRVVAESSTVTAPEPAHSFRSLEDAFKAAKETMEKYGVSSIGELRQIPAEKLAPEMSRHHHMTVDGYVLTETPYESYAKGIHNEEAQLHGFNGGEGTPFILLSQANAKNYEQKVRDAFDPPYSDRILELYPAADNKVCRKNWDDIYSAALFTYGHYCFEREALANDIPSYVYYFTKDNKCLGNWHSGEEVYLYGNIPEGSRLYDDSDRALSSIMLHYFVNFAKTGDPNGEGLPVWEQADGTDRVLNLDSEVQMTTAPYLELYEIYDDLYQFRSEN